MDKYLTIRVSSEKKKKAKYVLDTKGMTLSQAIRSMIDDLADEFDKKNSI